MADLTDTQRAFLEKYVLKRPITTLAALDLATPPAAKDPDAERATLEKDLNTLRELLARFGPPAAANAEDTGILTSLHNQAMGHLSAPFTRDGIKAAAQVVQAMRAPHAAALLHIRRDALLADLAAQEKRAGKALADDDAEEIATKVAAIRTALGAPALDEAGLDAAEVDIENLGPAVDAALDRAAQQAALRLKRRDEILAAQSDAELPEALTAEAQALQDALAAFPDLSGTPDDATLEKAEAALAALLLVVEQGRAAAAGRVRFATRMGQLLDRLTWGGADLKPEPGTPPGLTDPIKAEAAELQQAHAVLRDATRAAAWPVSDASGLDALATRIAKEVDGVCNQLADVTDAVLAVQARHAEVADNIGETHVFALSDAQQKALTDRADAAVKLLVDSLDQKQAALDALDDVNGATLGLQRDLNGFKLRIDRVDLTPANAAPAELTALTKLHKAAIDALGKALP